MVLSMVIMAMMVLTVVILASFLRVESAFAVAKQAEGVARLNALAAVRLAGAALQERLGPDTRVSAPASIYVGRAGANIPSANFGYPVLGVWRSWEGLDHDARPGSRYAGRPGAPDYTSKLKIYHPTTAPTARFLGWMVSDQYGYGTGPTYSTTDLTVGVSTPPVPPTVTSAATAARLPLPLIGSATDSTATRQVYSEPVSFADGRVVSASTDGSWGYFSWWVGGENQKARVMIPTTTLPSLGTDYLGWAQRNKTFGVPELATSVTLQSANYPSASFNYPTASYSNISYPDSAAKHYHDISFFSEGLLTNTATGGFRKDLSLFTETWDLAVSLDSSRSALMPLFRLLPANTRTPALSDPSYDLLYRRPLPDSQLPTGGVGNRKRNALLYWWADYGSLGGKIAGIASDGGTNFGGYNLLSSFPPIRSWDFLTDYCLHYRRYVSSPSPTLSGVTTMLAPPSSPAIPGDLFNYYERVLRHPLIARIQYVFAATGTGTASPYTPAFLVKPVVTLWNPYNVSLTVPAFRLQCKWGTMPIFVKCVNGTNPTVTQSVSAYKFKYSTPVAPTPAVPNPKPTWSDMVILWVGGSKLGNTITLSPGQTRIFSIPTAAAVSGAIGAGVTDIPRPMFVNSTTPASYDKGATYPLSPSANPSCYDLYPGYVATALAGWRMTLPVTTPQAVLSSYYLQKGIPNGNTATPSAAPSILEPDASTLTNDPAKNLLARDGIYYDYYPANYGTSGYSPVRFSFVGVTDDQFKLLYGQDSTTAVTYTPAPTTSTDFGTFSFGLRLSNDGIADSARTGAGGTSTTTVNGVKTTSRGALQVSPFTTYTELGQKSAEVLTAFRYSTSTVTDPSTLDVVAQVGLNPKLNPPYVSVSTDPFFTSTNTGIQYAGARNPLNAPYDLYFYNGTDAASYPQVGANNEGYIITGSSPATSGLGKAVVAELTVRPLQSLAGLQNCDIRATNPAPPFHFGLIGNSDASPILPSNDVVGRWIDQTGTLRVRDEIPASFLQYDDSYCLNHVLFDDWFVSSLAPKPADWSATLSTSSLNGVWSSFANGTSSLPNRCYQPTTTAASDLADLTVTAVAGTPGNPYSGNPTQPVAYQRVAASLRVPGQFNVNSTSVAAWRAMLGNLRNTTVPYIAPGGTTVSTVTAVNNPLARMAISHEAQVLSTTSTTTTAGRSVSVLGFASLTDAQLDQLAKEIVREVKVRGPFLSLSEFINRQLAPATTSNALDPWLRGAVASALRALENSATTSLNPAAKAQAVGIVTSKATDFNILDASSPPTPLKNSVPLGDWKSVALTPASTFPDYLVPAAALGHSSFGLPGWPRQADVLERLAPVISVRDETFVVRAMGASPIVNGTSTRVWCEAIYQRMPEYVNSTVPAYEAPLGDISTSAPASRQINVVLGRRFRLVSLRWIQPKDL